MFLICKSSIYTINMDKYSYYKKENKQGEFKKSKDNLLQWKLPISPDRELLLWEKWIRIRKEETTKLGHISGRPPTDLTMNLLKSKRKDKERKVAIENAQIDKKATCGYSIFEQPQRLKQRCKCECEPVYEIQRTNAELGHPRVIEHIGVPTHIKVTELGMAGTPQRKECVLLNADYVNYRQKREEDLAEKLTKIDPFRPSTDKLIVRGVKPKPLQPKIPRLPKINVEAPASHHRQFIEGVYAVRINKSVWYKDIPGQHLAHLATYERQPWHEDCSSWTYYFNVPVNRVGRGKIFLQNLGTVSLKYYWKKLKRQIPNIPQEMEQVFFFNKNEAILPPGQSKDICFTFVSDNPGIFHEYWELIFTNICFFETVNEKILINLYGDATEDVDGMKNKVEELKYKIHNESLYNMGKEILNEAIEKAFAVVPQTYPYKKYFLEAQLFVMKNPVCFYHQTEVTKMSDMFSNELTNGQTWDLSIATWRKEMMTKQYDERMRLFSALKVSHSDLLKPWYEGDTLLKEKYRAVNNLWAQWANNLDVDFLRLYNMFIENTNVSKLEIKLDTQLFFSNPNIRNIFYLHAYEHLANTIEQCAGILSSLDSNRWIEFDFCRS